MNQERVEKAIISPENFLDSGVDSRVFAIPPQKGEEPYLAKVYNRRLPRQILFDYFTLTNRLAQMSEHENWTMTVYRSSGLYRLRVVPFSGLIIALGYQVGIVPYIRTPRCDESNYNFRPFLYDLSRHLNRRFSTENIVLIPGNVRKNPDTQTLFITDLCASIARLSTSANTWLNTLNQSKVYE